MVQRTTVKLGDPAETEDGTRDDGGGGGAASLQQRLVEQQRASRGRLLLQTEDEVPEVNSRDPLTELLAGGGGRRGAGARA